MAQSKHTEATAPTSWTIDRVLAWAADDFASRQIDSARLDAELLLGHALGVDRIRLIIDRARPLAPDELATYRELIKRRRAGEPVAYIRGTREFYGLPFVVDRRALVPRPDTETLVEVALHRTLPRSLHGRALDLCTGSGCVAIAFAHQRPTWEIVGVDIDDASVELARENALRLGAVPEARFVTGDLFDPVAKADRFDLITANPPYIPTADYESLDPTIRDYEPRHALDGGADGLDLVRRIIRAAPAHLEPGGWLALEIGCDHGAQVRALLGEAGLTSVRVDRDCAGLDRVASARLAP